MPEVRRVGEGHASVGAVEAQGLSLQAGTRPASARAAPTRRSSAGDDSDEGDGDDKPERRMSRTEYLKQADLSQEWWIRIVVSAEDLGYTAAELLDQELPPDEHPYYPRPEANGQFFSWLAFVKPFEHFEPLHRYSRSILWGYFGADIWLEDWRFRHIDSHEYFDRRDVVQCAPTMPSYGASPLRTHGQPLSRARARSRDPARTGDGVGM